jgi:hypothetical protein
MHNIVVGVTIMISVIVGGFSYVGGLDEGNRRAYKYCVEHQARTVMLHEARQYCRAITGRK